MKKTLSIIIFSLLAAPVIFAHGVEIHLEQKQPGVVALCRYHGGSLLVDAAVQVRFLDKKAVFQAGRTDRNGCFCFLPDRAGTWHVRVDDGMGHAGRAKIEIGADFFQAVSGAPEPVEKPGEAGEAQKTEKPGKAAPLPYVCKILIGVVAILALTFILYWWKAKKR